MVVVVVANVQHILYILSVSTLPPDLTLSNTHSLKDAGHASFCAFLVDMYSPPFGYVIFLFFSCAAKRTAHQVVGYVVKSPQAKIRQTKQCVAQTITPSSPPQAPSSTSSSP